MTAPAVSHATIRSEPPRSDPIAASTARRSSRP
jgi:hypothetical protein